MLTKSIRIDYAINANGCPYIQDPNDAYATTRVSDNDGFQVTIEANRQGLRALATRLLALADDDCVPEHEHIDDVLNFVKPTDGVELIIQRLGK